MTKHVSWLFAGCCCLLLCLPAQARRHRLKIATQAPERSVWGEALEQAAKRLEKRSGGDIRLKVYAGGVQGDESFILRKMKMGQLHGGGFMGQGMSLVAPDMATLSVPFLFNDRDEVEHVVAAMRPHFDAQAERNGCVILAFQHLGFSYLFCRDQVQDVESFRQCKPWLIPDEPISKAFFDVMGVSPVPAQLADVLTSLQSGLIRSVFSPPVGMIGMQWHSRVQYRVDTKVVWAMGAVIVSKKSWDKLDAEQQKLVEEVFAEVTDELNDKLEEQNREALAVMKKNGVKTVQLTPEADREFRAAIDKVAAQLAGQEFSRQAFDRVQKLLAEYRAKQQD